MREIKKLKVVSIVSISMWIVTLIAFLIIKFGVIKVTTPSVILVIYFLHGVFTLSVFIFTWVYRVSKHKLENNK